MKKIWEQKYFILTILIGVGIAFKMHFDNTTMNTIYGVADTKETVVSFRFPVIIKNINVAPGQRVYKGDTLIETDAPELGVQILKMKSDLAELKARLKFNHVMNDHLAGVEIKASAKYAYTNPLQFQIDSLNQQISVLENEKADLNVVAKVDGVVGTVNVRPGERVAAFSPAITLIKNTPLFVRGYVHEYVNAKTFRYQRVTLRSFSRPSETVDGSIIQIGDRIVQFPEQLARGDHMALWGREIIIALPEENHFLVGEKLLVQLRGETIEIRGLDTQNNLLTKNQRSVRSRKL